MSLGVLNKYTTNLIRCSTLIPMVYFGNHWSYWILLLFTLPLQNDGQVCVLEDLLGLRFNLKLTMYVEHDVYNANGKTYEMIMMQQND